ncbi:MAG: hypothetical protein F6J92_06600 [Symploca sp. SIO1A3]|nr:hypothetical protein [Symploca sp. SIO1A3]
MAVPNTKRQQNSKGSRLFTPQPHKALLLVPRRCAAWVLEVSLVAVSAWIPYNIGLYIKDNSQAELVPLNPVVGITEEAIAKTLALPIREQLNQKVPPLTNLFWCGALVVPVVIGGWQLYLLAQIGQTTPKTWLGIRVVGSSGEPPGLVRAAFREGVGRWGLSGGVAYVLWRYTGAFPDINILLALGGLMLLAESAGLLIKSRRRTLHDQLAGTYVVDAAKTFPNYPGNGGKWSSSAHPQSVTLEVDSNGSVIAEETGNGHQQNRPIATIVLTPKQSQRRPQNLWNWMRQHPGITLLLVALGGMGSVLGTFVGTQIYIQSQANRREFKQQENEVFLALVKQLGSTSETLTEQRQGAILALARLDDDRALPYLIDLLGQEKNPSLIDTIQQALVSKGPAALPPLRSLNQSLQNDQEVLKERGATQEQQLVALRQRATKRAIAKIITIYNGQTHNTNLSRINLGLVDSGSTSFTLVLDNLDLSGINFRSANLLGASLRSTRFYGAGEDKRFGTFDDLIADLSGAELQEADLTGAVLNNTMLNRTNLIRATLNQANLSDSSLLRANLSSAKLIGADLRQATLENASLTGADLSEAKLDLSNLYGASLGEVSAVGAQFPFADLSQSNWQGADLSAANLKDANLRGADLSSTKLVGANLSNAQLQNAKFKYSNLSMTELQGSNVAGADFLGASFTTAIPIKSNEFIEAPNTAISGARVKGVNFAKAKNLDTQQINYICTHGGRHPRCP